MAHETETHDTAATVHALAVEMQREEEAKRQKARAKLTASAKAKKDAEKGLVVLGDGRPVEPLSTFMQSSMADFTSVPDNLIRRDERYGKWCVRWVRKLDNFGEPSDTEIEMFKRLGGEVIEGVKERRELIAMQIPPRGMAAFLARTAKPGSAIYDQAHGEFDDLVRTTNKRAGRRVVDTWTSQEHGAEDPQTVSFPR